MVFASCGFFTARCCGLAAWQICHEGAPYADFMADGAKHQVTAVAGAGDLA
jgi:hypothetical protein